MATALQLIKARHMHVGSHAHITVPPSSQPPPLLQAAAAAELEPAVVRPSPQAAAALGAEGWA